MILINAYKRHDWLMAAVERRLREELAELQVEINEEKSRIVDLGRGESFGFLGVRLPSGAQFKGRVACSLHAQAQEADGAVAEAQGYVGRNQSQPVGRVVKLINPVLRGG